MKIQFIAASAALCVALSGCGTIIEGTSQDIAVSTTPDGAHCDMTRKDEHVASIQRTPDKVHIKKTKNDILLVCTKDGYQNSSEYLHSGMAAGTFGNIIAGGVIGWGIDSATGADNEYPESVNVNLVPVGGSAPVQPSPGVVRNSIIPNS
jgi:hypothetical protein